jgi:hypothetical protein
MKITATLTFFIYALVSDSILWTSAVHADIFGSGANQFDIAFVSIGNPHNLDDTTGSPNPVGKVEYFYRMGKFEISEDMINKANILGALGITHQNHGANKPATSISWFEAARFVNWLNTSTGHTPAYKFNGSTFELWHSGDTGYNPSNPFRNRQAFYFLPSADEWYKAAYYDPDTSRYYDYPTGSNIPPDGIDFAGDTRFQAVFYDGGRNPYPNDITDVGVLSPYGTGGQGGNVWELEETEFDLVNDSSAPTRGARGGGWNLPSVYMRASARSYIILPESAFFVFGFRVASIPEPSTVLMGVLVSAGMLLKRRRYATPYPFRLTGSGSRTRRMKCWSAAGACRRWSLLR